MKKIIVSLLLFVAISCRPTDVIDVGYILEVFVGDATNFGVEGATVTLYTTIEDFQNNTNPVATAQTNNRGIALFKGLKIEIIAYFIGVERGEENNWEENKFIAFRLDEQNQSYKTKIKGSIANKIAGRFAKRWRKVAQFINNTANPNCDVLTEQVFRRDWFIQIFNGRNCPNPGGNLGSDIWSVTLDNRGIIRGVPGGSSERRYSILELNDNRFVYVETPLQGFTIREEFVAVN